VAALSLVASVLATRADAAPGPVLKISSTANRSNSSVLEGSSAKSNVYIFADTVSPGSTVAFYLDDPTMSKAPARTETTAPFDFAGTAADNVSSQPSDTNALADGPHSITTRVTMRDQVTSSTTSSFTVANRAPAPTTTALAGTTNNNLFANATPASAAVSDAGAVEIGTKFSSDTAGKVTGIRFYKGTGNTGTHTGNLWSSTGTKLASVTFANETATGWQTANLATPVAITAGTSYVVSYFAPAGHYAADGNWFNAATNKVPLHAPAGANGVYRYGTASGFPTNAYQSTNYWVDVSVQTSTTTTTGAPTTSTTTTKPTATTVAPTTTTTTAPGGSATSCPLPKYPTPACTGVRAGTTLTTINGDVTLSTPGQVLENKRVTGAIYVAANNVVIRNVEVSGAIRNHVNGGSWKFTVEDTTVGPTSGCTDIEMMGYQNYTARRVHMRNVGDAFRVSGSNILIEDSYVNLCSKPGDHSDGIQGYGGGINVTVSHNTIDQRNAADVTSPIFFADNSRSAIVRNNLLAGGGYSLRLHDDNNPDVGPWVATGNRIVDGSWRAGPVSTVNTNCATTTWTDNRLVTIDSNYNVTSLGATVGC
jgi:hypothetical protein